MASKKATKSLKKGKRVQPVKNLRKAGGGAAGTGAPYLNFKFTLLE